MANAVTELEMMSVEISLPLEEFIKGGRFKPRLPTATFMQQQLRQL